MSVEPVSVERVATLRPAPAPAMRVLVGLAAASTVLLGAATFGLVPRLPVVGVAAAAALALPTGLLARLAHSARRHARGPLRGSRPLSLALLSLALLMAGLTVAAALAPVTAGLAVAGLTASAALVAPGLFLLPGSAPTGAARLRQGLDCLGVTMCFLFVGWVLAVSSRHPVPRLPLLAGLVTAASLAVAVTTALRAVRHRFAARACAAGATLVIVGLAVLDFERTAALGPHWLPAAGACLAYGPVLIWSAAHRYAPVPQPWPLDPDTVFAGTPVLALPIAGVLVAAVYHLLTTGGFDHTGALLGCAVVAAVTTREICGAVDMHRYTRQAARREAHFRSLVAGSTDVVLVLDADLVVRWQSPAAARQFGLSDQDVLGHAFTSLVHPDDLPAVRDRIAAALAAAQGAPPPLLPARLRDGSGHWRDTESTISDQRAVPEVGALVVHVRDVGARHEPQGAPDRAAFTDPLTGLANRRQVLRTVAAMRELPGQPGALLVIEADRVTAADGAAGPEVCDAVLVELARRLRDAVDESELPARLDGPRFAVVTAGQPVRAYALANRIIAMFSQPYQLSGAPAQPTASVGLAELSGASSAGDALSRADLAVRRARQLGHGRIEWYDDVLAAALLRRLVLEQELPGAVARNELDLVYQPVVDLVDGLPVGAEALLRWRHPRLGTVEAADFVPVAEDLGLIGEIGVWALRRGCRQLAAWLRDGHDLWLAVNLAARQLAAPDLVATVSTALDTHRVPAERLVLEVTEHTLAADGAVDQLAGLRALGVRTALAGFGTGSTPLAHLRRLPVDVLKVDRILVAEPGGRPGSATPIIDIVVGLGRRLGLEIVAEGLEAQAHLESVRTAGCRYGQGYLFGRPTPAEHFEALLSSRRSPTA